MNKKKVGVLIAGVVILAGIGFGAGAYLELVEENKSLSQTLSATEDKVVSIENEKALLEEENLNIKNENELLRVELLDLQEQYEELNGKYQKEISPASFKE